MHEIGSSKKNPRKSRKIRFLKKAKFLMKVIRNQTQFKCDYRRAVNGFLCERIDFATLTPLFKLRTPNEHF